MKRYLITAGLACTLLCGCASTQQPKSPADDATWTKLVERLNQPQWTEADKGSAFERAQRELGLENFGAMELGGTLSVARGNRTAAHAHPFPSVWRTQDQKVVCAGDLNGDGRTEYVLGCGWFGPMGGALCVYDGTLRKVAEVALDDVFALRLEDLIGDGGLEVLCWQDHHNGTDGWRRYLTIFRFSEIGGLTPVWEGDIYSFSTAGGIDVTKHTVRFIRKRGQPTIIARKHTYSRGTHEDTDNATSYSYLQTPDTVTRFVWDPVSEKFESVKEQSDNEMGAVRTNFPSRAKHDGASAQRRCEATFINSGVKRRI